MAAEEPTQETQDPEQPSAPGWRAAPRRLLRAAAARLGHRRAQTALVIGLVTAAVIGLGVVWSLLSPKNEPKAGDLVTLERALAELDKGSLEAARQIATILRQHVGRSPDEVVGANYVLGIVTTLDVPGDENEEEKKLRMLLAARYLHEASVAGFPAGRRGHGEFELGRSLHQCGLYAKSLPPLHAALKSYPEQTTEILRLLADSYYRDANPQLDRSLEFNRLYLGAGELSSDERVTGLLMQARILVVQGAVVECNAALKQIPEDSDRFVEALLLKGRLLMYEGDQLRDAAAADDAPLPPQATEKYTEAMAEFRKAQERRPDRNDVVRRSKYLMGMCYAEMGEQVAALHQFTETHRANFDTPTGMAAGLEVADLQRLIGNDDDALKAYRNVLSRANEMRVYSNPWVPFDEFHGRIEQAYLEYLKADKFAQAIALAEAMSPFVAEEKAIQKQAEAQVAWAQHLEEEAGKKPRSEALPLERQARASWRQAGNRYAQLAKMRFTTRQYTEDLWASAQGFLKGQDYERAVGFLEAYLENQTRQTRPQALNALGQSKLALNQPNEALVPLTECVAFYPRDPFSYRARLLAAQANVELGNLEQAKKLLSGNLEHESLTPKSIEWRESLYALGRIFYHEGVQLETQSRSERIKANASSGEKESIKIMERAYAAFQEAIRTLSEAVARDEAAGRDPFGLEKIEATYLTAEARRRSAKLPRRKLASVTIETTRLSLDGQMRKELNAAMELYEGLQVLLNNKQEQLFELSDFEESILRNCYFAHADSLYDLGRYEEAIQAYSTATNRYQHEPESLEAFVQIANCHRQRDRLAEARGTLEQAKVVLERIRPDADFTQTTRYDREQWSNLLDWLSTL